MNLFTAGVLWVALLPFHMGVWVLKYPLSPLAVACCTTDDGKQLDFPFQFLTTNDNDLGGDDGWKNKHIEPGSDPYSYWNKVGWLWRNGGHDFNYNILGVDYDPSFEFEKGFNDRDDGFWMLRTYVDIPFTDEKVFEFMWGWHLQSNENGKSKYVFTNRTQDLEEMKY